MYSNLVFSTWLFAISLFLNSEIAFPHAEETLVLSLESYNAMKDNIQTLRQEMTALTQTIETLKLQLVSQERRTQYPVSDQLDHVNIALKEALMEQEKSQYDTPFLAKALEVAQESSGSIPKRRVLDLKRQVEVDEFQSTAIDWKVKTYEAKRLALEALLKNNYKGFLTADKDTNYAQSLWYEFQLKAAEVEYIYAKEYSECIENLRLVPSIQILERKLEADLRRVEYFGWKRKLAEQLTQLAKAEEALKQFSP